MSQSTPWIIPFVLALPACSGDVPEPPPIEVRKPSLVLVTLDTTRADHIGAYGYEGARTPTLDALAGEGLRLDRAYATVPLTTPSHASMMTGLYPTRHGIHTNGDAILGEGLDTLAERLDEAGYRTGASVAAFVTTSMWNLDQGFDTYSDNVGRGGDKWARERPANEVIDDALEFVQAGDGPFFLWVHVFDAHAPYEPPEPFKTEMAGHPYDAEIAFVDSQLARLKAAVPDDAGWIVIADHGEALEREHGESSHGMFLYDPTMRVPFVVRPPGGGEGSSSDLVVSGVDVMPTALGMLGQPVPEGLDGVDLSPMLRGEPVDRGPVYMESNTVLTRFGYHPEWAVAHGDHKWMATPNAHLYNVAQDPREQANLLPGTQDLSPLKTFLEAVRAARVSTEDAQLGPEVLAQLEALGYVAGTTEAVQSDADLPQIDAKDRLETIRKLEAVQRLSKGGDAEVAQAEVLFREIIASEPQLAEARVGLGRLLTKLGRLPEAEQTYRDALAAAPSSTVVRANLAHVLAAQGRFDEALLELAANLEQVPGDDGARVAMLKMLAESGRYEEALKLAEGYLEEEPDHPAFQAMAGVLLMERGDAVAAEPLLRASLSDERPHQYVHRMLGRLEASRGNNDKAVFHIEEELNTYPRNSEARQALGQLYMGLKRWEDAAAEFGFLIERDPTNREARRGAAQAAFNVGDYARAEELLAPVLDTADSNVLLLQANILSKLGRPDEGKAMFDRAQTLRAAEAKAKGAKAKAKAPVEGAATP